MWWMTRSRTRPPAAALGTAFVLYPLLLSWALLHAGCSAIANVAVATPAIFLSQESGLHHEVVEFHQFQNEQLVHAPASAVWQAMTTVSKLPSVYPWMERMECPRTAQDRLALGQSIEYQLKLVGLDQEGTAVVTEVDPEKSLGMTLFSRSRGTLRYRLTPENGNTRLTIMLTTMIPDLSMKRPASEVKRALSDGLGQTLKSIALESEGKPLDPQLLQEESRMSVCTAEATPFDVVKGVITIDLPPPETWKFFNLTGRNPLFFSRISKEEPENLRNYLGKLGNGVPYKERLGPFELKGLAVVTSVDPGRSISLALFSDLKAGADYEFRPEEDGKTLFSALYYLQIPSQYKGKPVDRAAVVQEMRTLVDREMDAFKLRCEQLAGKDRAS